MAESDAVAPRGKNADVVRFPPGTGDCFSHRRDRLFGIVNHRQCFEGVVYLVVNARKSWIKYGNKA